MRGLWLPLILSVGLGYSVQAVEPRQSLGEIEVSRLLIEPTFFVAEPKTASFEFSRALLGIRWKNDNHWSAHFVVGPSHLLAVPFRYGLVNETLTLLEAYGQWDSGLGVVRAGIIPLDFGLQGASEEEVLWFPRGLIYQKGFLGLRDFGISYFIHEGLFFTQLAIHNGEGGTDKDNRAWLTGKWGLNPKNLQFGVSAQVGQTTPSSTNQSGNPSQDLLFSPSDNHRLRLGSFFVKSDGEYFKSSGEVYLAEILTEKKDSTQLAGWYLDMKYRVNSWLQVLLRYDELRTYPATGREKYSQAIGGLAFNNWNETSHLFVYAIKNFEEPSEISNDRLQIHWRWTPQPLN